MQPFPVGKHARWPVPLPKTKKDISKHLVGGELRKLICTLDGGVGGGNKLKPGTLPSNTDTKSEESADQTEAIV